LKIILAHPPSLAGRALSVATHKRTSISPLRLVAEYFPPILVRYINSILQDKMLFRLGLAGDHAGPLAADFSKLEIRDEIRPKVLKANARRILGIDIQDRR